MKLTIRRAEPKDYPGICSVFSQPGVVRETLQLPYPSAEIWRKRLADAADDIVLLVADADGQMVGQFGLHTFPHLSRRRHAARLGMAVHDAWQGKGIGAALLEAGIDLADNWLNLTRLELEVFTENEAAIRLYRKFGFIVEGTLKQFAYRDGQYSDAHLMARIRG